MKINNLKESIEQIYKINCCKRNENIMLDYNIDEGSISIDWYKAILEEVKKFKPKRVVDIGSNLNMFGYLFENEDIEYIGVEETIFDVYDNKILPTIPLQTNKIKLINANYYDVRKLFKDDILISCLCVGYLIPVEDTIGKHLIVNSDNGKHNNKYKCTARLVY